MIKSARDVLVLGLDSAERNLREALADLTEAEYNWEPIPESERAADCLLPTERKRVWRVFEQGGVWTYDYALGEFHPSPFTTIAWLLNHVAQTADVYLYCIQSGKPEGVDRRWEDLPVPSTLEAMSRYAFEVLARVRAYLTSIPEQDVVAELNRPTPAPWGELRPTYLNLWGGVIEHTLVHAAQIAAWKDQIRRAPGR